MASAGVVGMAEVVQPNSGPTSAAVKGQPVMWSMIWTAAAVLFIVWVHLALAGRGVR